MKTCFVPTSFAEHFAKKIKKRNLEVVLPDLNREGKRYFPDGEVYIRLSRVKEMKAKRLIVLHSGAPKPNEGLIKLELILQILKQNNIKPEIFFTYFPYGRQDKIFEKGEANAAENLVKKLINYYCAKKIYVIDAHFWQRQWVKKYQTPLDSKHLTGQVINISAVPFLIEKVKKNFPNQEILFLATDKGGQRRFKIAGFEKVRKNSFQIELNLSKKLASLINPVRKRQDFEPTHRKKAWLSNGVKGKVVCLVDDLIETGETLLKAGDLAKKYGAKKVVCLATHCLLKEGVKKIRKKFSKVYLTNTIEQPKIPQIDITPLILNAIDK